MVAYLQTGKPARIQGTGKILQAVVYLARFCTLGELVQIFHEYNVEFQIERTHAPARIHRPKNAAAHA